MARWVLFVATLGFCATAGLAQSCPQGVKKVATWGQAKDLAYDGWFFGTNDAAGAIAVASPIKNASITPLKTSAGTTFKVQNCFISPDGKWGMALSGSSIALVKREGWTVTLPLKKADGTTPAVKKVVWYYSSPRQNPSAGRWEIAYTYTSSVADVYAGILDVGGATPVIKEERKLSEGLNFGTTIGELAVAADKMVVDMGAGAYLFTIPDAGMGKATMTDRYPLSERDNCALSINFTGTQFACNNNTSNSCVPPTHHGFGILTTTPSLPTTARYADWLLAQGSVVIWAPQELDGVANLNSLGKNVEFWPNKFSNHPDYMITNNTSKISTVKPHTYILQISTNTWTRIADAIGWNSVYLDNVGPTPLLQPGHAARHHLQLPNAQAGVGPARWHDLMGRATDRMRVRDAAVLHPSVTPYRVKVAHEN